VQERLYNAATTEKRTLMPEVDIQRLLGPEAGEIFMQFPLPLVLVNDAGSGQFNARFSQFFDRGCIGTPALRDVLGESAHGTARISSGWSPRKQPAASASASRCPRC
jgi:hypothetical protein